MKRNVYEEARTVARVLRDAGLVEYADQVASAVSDSSTGTEIFMMLRWQLEKVIKDPAVPRDIKISVASLFTHLNEVLTSG